MTFEEYWDKEAASIKEIAERAFNAGKTGKAVIELDYREEVKSRLNELDLNINSLHVATIYNEIAPNSLIKEINILIKRLSELREIAEAEREKRYNREIENG